MKKAIYSFTLFVFFIGCNSSIEEKDPSIFLGNAMTMDYKVIIGNSHIERKKIQNIIDSTFFEIDAIYNKWNPQSELSALNQLKAYEKKRLSPQMEAFLIKTKEMALLTHGFFDPTVESLENLWKKAFAEKKIPEEEDIKKTLLAVGLNKIVIEDSIFYKTHDLLSLDLGGIAKGYAVDLLTSHLNDAGYENVFVEWGGEIKATGDHPDKRPWRIFISRLHDQDPEHAISHVDLKNEAIATSGDYLQNWTVRIDNKTFIYSHIFDPKTGYPLEITRASIASATVLHKSCLMADAIATALMLFKDQESAKVFASSLQKEDPDMQFWIVSRQP